MDIYIPKEQMPMNCKRCHCYHVDYEEGCWCSEGVWCNLGYDSCNYSEYETRRHPDCSLKPIDQWRLKSCETCRFDYDDCNHRAYPRDTFNQTCKDWQGKVNE